MIGPSRRGCGQNAGEVATATVRGTACCSEPSPHAAAVADSLVTEDGHGSVARRPDDAPRFDSVRPAPWRRTSDRPTSPTLGGGPGAARQPTDFAVRGKGRAEGKSRTRTDTGDRPPPPSYNTLAKQGGSMETPFRSTPALAASRQARAGLRQGSSRDRQTSIGHPCGRRRTRACPGPSKRVCPPAGAAGTQSPNVRPTRQTVPRPATSRSAKSSKTPLGRRGGRGVPRGQGSGLGSPSRPKPESAQPHRHSAARLPVHRSPSRAPQFFPFSLPTL